MPISLTIKKIYIELITTSISIHPRKIKIESSEKLFALIKENDPNIYKPMVDSYDAI